MAPTVLRCSDWIRSEFLSAPGYEPAPAQADNAKIKATVARLMRYGFMFSPPFFSTIRPDHLSQLGPISRSGGTERAARTGSATSRSQAPPELLSPWGARSHYRPRCPLPLAVPA